MKKYLFLLGACLLAGSQQLQAQDTATIEVDANGRNYQQIADSLFRNLDKSRVPYGVLANRVYLGDYMGGFQNGDTIAANTINQLYHDAEKATLPKSGFTPKYTTVAQDNYIAGIQGDLPLMVVHYNMGLIKEDAYATGALKTNSQGLPIDGIATLLPYTSFNCKAAGLAVQKVYQDATYRLSLPAANILENAGGVVSATVTNLSTLATYTLSPGGTKNIRFEQPGTVYLKISITFSGLITWENVAAVEAVPSGPLGVGDCEVEHRKLESRIAFKGEGEAHPTTTWIDYHIYRRFKPGSSTDCESQIARPVIILDGFDPKNLRNHNELYNQYLKNQSGNRIGELLRQKGFDVIIVNFPVLGQNGAGTGIAIPNTVKKETSPGVFSSVNLPGRDGGTDFIERNAMALVALIQDINQELGLNGVTNKELVIVGPSMGGQISRYALAYMEKQHSLGKPDMVHHVRNWVSFDSPHDGANISLGHQYALKFFGDVIGSPAATGALDSQLLSVAARQMLVEQIGGRNNTAPLRAAHYSRLKANGLSGSNGYPTTTRKVALTNGSGAGTNYRSPGSQVVEAWGKKITWLFGGIKFFEYNVWAMPNYNANHNLFRVRGAIQGLPNILMVTTAYDDITNINPRGSMDIVPGGNLDVQSMIKSDFVPELILKKIALENQHWEIKKGMSFIPTISALGFKNPNFNWSQRVDNRNLVCNDEIYFDNYFVPALNEDHIADPDNNKFINDKSVAWLLEEIEKGQPGCPAICATKLNGSTAPLCLNATRTFTLDAGIPSGAGFSIAWSTSSGLQILSSNLSSITVKATSNEVNGYVKATIHNPCGANKDLVTATFPIGIPTTHIFFTQQQNPCLYKAKVQPYVSAYTYQWSTNGTTFYDEGEFFGPFQPYSNVDFPLWVKITTPCGTTVKHVVLPGVPTPGNCLSRQPYDQRPPQTRESYLVEIYPNPSSHDWQVLTYNYLGKTIDMRLSDINGRQLWQTTLHNAEDGSTRIPNTEFANGVYILQVKTDDNIQTFKLVKQ